MQMQALRQGLVDMTETLRSVFCSAQAEIGGEEDALEELTQRLNYCLKQGLKGRMGGVGTER